ncbi:hypothetical protein J6590_053523 [Homalodisca vitripennis]|nr:hypothetical protein J6590_053523 [Homalodisca vitripennis]
MRPLVGINRAVAGHHSLTSHLIYRRTLNTLAKYRGYIHLSKTRLSKSALLFLKHCGIKSFSIRSSVSGVIYVSAADCAKSNYLILVVQFEVIIPLKCKYNRLPASLSARDLSSACPSRWNLGGLGVDRAEPRHQITVYVATISVGVAGTCGHVVTTTRRGGRRSRRRGTSAVSCSLSIDTRTDDLWWCQHCRMEIPRIPAALQTHTCENTVYRLTTDTPKPPLRTTSLSP